MSGVDVLAAIDGLLDLARHRVAMKRRGFDRQVAAGKEPHHTDKIKADRAEYLQEMGKEARAAVAELMTQRDQFRDVTKMIAALNPECPEIGAGKIRQLVDAAESALARCRGGAA